MTAKVRILALSAAIALVMSACSTGESTSTPKKEEAKVENKENASSKEAEKTESEEEKHVDYAAVFKEANEELAKAENGGDVDYDKVIESYKSNLQPLVQKRDNELGETIDQNIITALEAGKSGEMEKMVSKQLFDKLMQKVFYTTIKHEFTEINENWDDKEAVKEEIEEAKEFYAILESTVQKRDNANGTKMVDNINAGFGEIEKAAESGDKLSFQLGKQVVDKTLMKTFYLATGAVPNGYATKAAGAAKENPTEAKIEQAEGWAFYQSIQSYVAKHSPEEGALIQKQFDLQTDVKTLDPEAVNKAFVRGFAKVALDEYAESKEKLGNEEAAITGLEGALFIDIIGNDIKALIGEDQYNQLTEKAQKYVEAAKSKDKAPGEALLKEIEPVLNSVIEKAK